MKDIINKILFPHKLIGFFAFNLGFGLLIYVFCASLEETPLAYISYVLSFYSLVIFCIWFYKFCKNSHESIKKSKIYNFYQKKFLVITKISMFCSFIFNLIFGIFELGIGIYYMSWWFITFSIYYLLLCFIRVSLVKNINNHEKEYKKLKHTGIILLLLNLILIGIIVLIITQEKIVNYNGILIYFVAMYDFYLIISAFINVFKYRKKHSPILTSSKCINLTVAMISLVSLEVAMVYQFGDNDSNFKLIMTSIMGFVICLINSFMAIYMIIKANNNLKNKKLEFIK